MWSINHRHTISQPQVSKNKRWQPTIEEAGKALTDLRNLDAAMYAAQPEPEAGGQPAGFSMQGSGEEVSAPAEMPSFRIGVGVLRANRLGYRLFVVLRLAFVVVSAPPRVQKLLA